MEGFAEDFKNLCKKHNLKVFLDNGRLSVKVDDPKVTKYCRVTDLLPNLSEIATTKGMKDVFGYDFDSMSKEEIIRLAMKK
jgi:hypothetical protein